MYAWAAGPRDANIYFAGLNNNSRKVEEEMGNPGIALDLGWVNGARVNKAAVDRRAKELGVRRSIKKQWQLAWLVRAIECIDLTTLSGDDTPGRVQRLCAKARSPIECRLKEQLGVENLRTGAVCVYPSRVADAGWFFFLSIVFYFFYYFYFYWNYCSFCSLSSLVAALKGTGIPVASVATGFPAGQTPLELRLAEIRQAVAEYVFFFILLLPIGPPLTVRFLHCS